MSAKSKILKLLIVGLPLLGLPLAAQAPATLLGAWQMRQISFVASRSLSPELLEQLDNPEIAELNNALKQGNTELRVAFKPDGTYQFGCYEAGQAAWIEAGTYHVAGGVLYGLAPAAPTGSSFEQQRVVELTHRKLVLEFDFGADSLQLVEQVEYRRSAE